MAQSGAVSNLVGQYLSVREVAARLSCSYDHALRIMIRAGAEKQGRYVRISEDTLASYLATCKIDKPKDMGSVVYFVAGGELIKIGTTIDLETRLKDLQNMSATAIAFLSSMPGGYKEERELHVRFAHLRAHGEWFRRGDDLLAFIDSIRDAG